MTQRKPGNVSWESWIERQIREAQERGEFENLPGAGKPIPGLDKPHDPLWWVRQLLERENLSIGSEVFDLKKRIEEVMARIQNIASEAWVRRLVSDLNEEIVQFNKTQAAGPGPGIAPFSVDEVVKRWRNARSS